MKTAGVISSTPAVGWSAFDQPAVSSTLLPRVPGKASPTIADWQSLATSLSGELIEVQSPLEICKSQPETTAAKAMFENMKNPFFLEEQPQRPSLRHNSCHVEPLLFGHYIMTTKRRVCHETHST